MQDMVPNNKRSIRNIDTKTSSEERAEDTASRERVHRSNHLPPQPRRMRSEGRLQKFLLWVVGGIVLVALIVIVLSFGFSGAQLAITPRTESVTLDAEFRAYASAPSGELPFEVITQTRSLSKVVPASGETNVEEKASGTIVVFNDFDESDQRLIANTRFETPEGLIYRIQEAIIVPGQYTNEEGEVVPGSIEVEVYADEAGEEYNVGLTDFTIPGFEENNDPRFFKFFARSKSPLEGGFVGVQKTVSEEDEADARAELQSQLQDALSASVVADLEDTVVLYDDALFTTFETQPIEADPQNPDQALIVETGTVHAVVFDISELARHIAREVVATYSGESVAFDPFDTLTFTIPEKGTYSPNSLEIVEFMLEGEGNVTWVYDEERLIADLAGKHKRDVDMVLSAYPSIERAEINLRPFWRNTFPQDGDKFKIEQTTESSS